MHRTLIKKTLMHKTLMRKTLTQRTYSRDKLGRIAALLSAIILICMLFFSMFFIAAEAGHHECAGEDCPICATVEMCINTIKSIGTLAIAVASGITGLVYIILKPLFTDSEVVKSPVLERVRMNN